ncbi:hypothetical protein FP2506_17704 [Fulvimarina pelagi HTCC2506]|uniref:Uncharacterized protein n=1 Tax=Fulvimarina pelagi HTCC2506 TaxID=314231 RepID=Q0FY07_9HYPH|nr:hypothetical protein FP2506_17704 [Fulvimarina pelagi HTCC2506]
MPVLSKVLGRHADNIACGAKGWRHPLACLLDVGKTRNAGKSAKTRKRKRLRHSAHTFRKVILRLA